MPYQIRKVKNKYKLWKIKEKVFAKPTYNTREAAINAGKNFMRYRKEIPVVKGNRILSKGKK